MDKQAMDEVLSSTVKALLGLHIDGHSNSIITASAAQDPQTNNISTDLWGDENDMCTELSSSGDPEASDKAKEHSVKLSKTQKKNRRARKSTEKKRYAEKRSWEVMEARDQEIYEKGMRDAVPIVRQETLALLMGLPKDEVHVHSLKLDPECLAEIQAIERATSAPAKHDDPRFAKLGVEWMSAPGYHIGIDDTNSTRSEIVFVVKITPWDVMPTALREHIQENLHTLMDWSECVQAIKSNAAHKAPQGEIPGSVNRYGQIHGQQEAVNQSAKKPRGKMYGVGWHAAMQKGMTLAYYAPKSSSDNTVLRYEDLLKKLPNVANLYRTRFAMLFPGGATEMMKTSAEHHVISFDNILDGTSASYPFANCLTLTNDNFANFQHRDKDFIASVYGVWWTSSVHSGTPGPTYSLGNHVDHSVVKCGGFVWGLYRIAVDFSKASGLVEICWRGKRDFHATMDSSSLPSVTRWGTSVQLTNRGVNAMDRIWQLGNLKKVLKPSDHVLAKENKGTKNKRKAEQKETAQLHKKKVKTS